jgi:hypothetical protein
MAEHGYKPYMPDLYFFPSPKASLVLQSAVLAQRGKHLQCKLGEDLPASQTGASVSSVPSILGLADLLGIPQRIQRL